MHLISITFRFKMKSYTYFKIVCNYFKLYVFKQQPLWHHGPSRQKPIFNPLKKWFDETPPQVQKNTSALRI